MLPFSNQSPLRYVLWGAVSVSLSLCALSPPPALAQSNQDVDFNRDIRPILSENCFFCHGPDPNNREADLRLDVESESHHAIEPGDAKNSELFLRISTSDKDVVMPPPDSNRSLTVEEIRKLKQWIDAGAPWAKHWAFAPIKKKKLPTEQAIDYFIERKLKQHQLQFSPQADKATLIRRVSLDLTGLPPTLEQLDQFLADTSEDAYAKMVDRMLDAPAYGERMAWIWLDAARYADSNGYQGDNERTMWPWRDWVVKSYNENLPFDQFSVWQLAGDLLPDATHEQILATGFNRNHPINGEGGRIPEENRIDYGMDMAETAGTVWMGLTFNCCRCHDHKYDALTQEDYYSLFAFFDQTPVKGGGGNAQTPPVLAVPDAKQKSEKTALENSLKELKRKRVQRTRAITKNQSDWESSQIQKHKTGKMWQPLVTSSWSAESSELKKLDDESLLNFGNNADQDVYQITGATSLKRITGVRLEVLSHSSMKAGGLARSPSSNFVLTDFSISIDGQLPSPFESAKADFEQGFHPVSKAIDDDPSSGWAVLKPGQQKGRQQEAVFVLQHAIDISANSEIKVVLRQQSRHKQHNIGRFKLFVTDHVEPTLAGAKSDFLTALRTPAKRRSKEQIERVKQKFLASDPVYSQFDQLINQETERLKQLNQAIPKVMVMADMPKRRKSFRLNRGSYEQPRNEVFPRIPEMFLELKETSTSSTQPSNRLTLANWLFDDSNPLTPRVTVNRLWAQFFGIGLVKTSEDFGVQAEPPSHPQMLDWLAAEYRDSGWDTKHMIRLILNSKAYRQTSITNPRIQNLDPKNRLISHASRFRMPSWMLRDHALATSGLLVRKLGGQPVNTYQPGGVWEEASFGKKVYRRGQGEELYRRTLYTFWRRIASPTMIFDNADRMTCSVKRYLTNTPLHALNTLNDITFVEASRVMASRVLKDEVMDNERLNLVFRLVLARQPNTDEKTILLAALDRTRRQFDTDLEAAKKFISLGDSPIPDNLEAVELASWTSLCLAVLNLDEALTRQ